MEVSANPPPVWIPDIPEKTISILMIEDCPSDIYLVDHMLEEASPSTVFNIKTAARLTDAFQLLKTEKFHVILLDLNLVDVIGVVSISALHAEVPDIPIIVCSGMEDPTLTKKALACGAKYFLNKGKLSGGELKTLIESYLPGSVLWNDVKSGI